MGRPLSKTSQQGRELRFCPSSVCLSHTHTPPWPHSVYFTPRVMHVRLAVPRASWDLMHRALTGLPTRSCGQTCPLDPLSPRNTFADPPRTRPWTLTLASHMQASSLPLRTPGHSLPPRAPHLGLLPSLPRAVAQLLPSCLLPTCSAQGPGRTGLAFVLFAKAAGLWPLAPAGQQCRNRPF